MNDPVALAHGDPEPLAKSAEALKAGPIGLAVILLLCIACYFLFKSMSKHLKTVRDDFPNEPPRTAPPLEASTRSVDPGPVQSATSLPEPARTDAPQSERGDGPAALT